MTSPVPIKSLPWRWTVAKRVSLRGKGADIFFGNYQPAAPAGPGSTDTPAPPPAAPAPSPRRKRTVKPAVPPTTRAVDADRPEAIRAATILEQTPRSEPTPPPSKHTNRIASKQARLQASIDTNQVTERSLAPEVLDAVLDSVSEPATITNSFRYTEQELSWLTDALYELGKRHGAKLTKQDVARLGLNLVLWDYRARGDTSLLGSLALRRRRRR
jgi:hypothetical protein